jgi:hypothetical protein
MKNAQHAPGLLLFALVIGFAAPGWAAMNKCVDAQGKTTYSDQPCPYDSKASKPAARPSAGNPIDAVVLDASEATASGDWEGMRRSAARPEQFDKAPPGAGREKVLKFLKYVAPVQVVIVSREVSPDGRSAVVLATGMYRNMATELLEPTKGRISLVQVNGSWKIDKSEWGPNKW